MNKDEETEELARILSGTEMTDAVRGTAKEMKELAQGYKEKLRV